MRLTTRGRGRGRGHQFNVNQPSGGIIGQGPVFRPNLQGVQNSSMGFTPGGPTVFGRSYGFNPAPPRRGFGRFRRNNFNKSIPRSNGVQVPEFDLTKPWVTEDIRNEERKKQEVFELWKNTKTNENWALFQTQKLAVQALYDKAKTDYITSHPNEAYFYLNNNSNNKGYFCETCDKSFRTEEDLLVHNSEHETCGREGCQFTAHPKLIAKHIKMQHESGLYKRIGKLYTDEDIAKWIEERKKRYPTRKLVEEKKILEQEKINRGERIKESDSRFNKSFSNKGKSGLKKNFEKKGNKNNKNRRRRKEKKVSVVEKCIEEEVTEATRKGVPAFLGINTNSEREIPEKENFNISDEEWETETKLPEVAKPLLNSSLGLLATIYDSDEENENEETIKEVKEENLSADEGSGPEEVSSKNPPAENVTDEKVSQKRKFLEKKDRRGKRSRNMLTENNFEKRSLTLLEKLLKDEIRHERNVILQCNLQASLVKKTQPPQDLTGNVQALALFVETDL